MGQDSHFPRPFWRDSRALGSQELSTAGLMVKGCRGQFWIATLTPHPWWKIEPHGWESGHPFGACVCDICLVAALLALKRRNRATQATWTLTLSWEVQPAVGGLAPSLKDST